MHILKLKRCTKSERSNVRALIGTNSKYSYILKSTVLEFGSNSKSKELMVHCLFEGTDIEAERKVF